MIRKSDLANWGRGVLMGGADIVPGVSGGTVALILGIYERLVAALSRFDAAFLRQLRRGQWRQAAGHVDLRFLAALAAGIASGILSLASLLHYMFEDQEHVSIHSISSDGRQVVLNVGTQRGGLREGTELTVYRPGRIADETGGVRSQESGVRSQKTEDRKQPATGSGRTTDNGPRTTGPPVKIAELRIERYTDAIDAGQSTVRRAVAVRIDEGNEPIRLDDVVTHPSGRRPPTLGLFFGLILASSVLVARMIDRLSLGLLALTTAGAAFAYWLVGLLPAAPPEGLWYLFLVGGLAICAMILPGISGAFIMLLMGVYVEVAGLLRGLPQGRLTPEGLLKLAVFAGGCAVGLLSFSRLLRWLLGRHERPTMAVLCGLMIGSLRKIWPFKIDLSPETIEFKRKYFVNTWPETFDATVWLTFGMMALGFAIVFAVDALSRHRGQEVHLGE